MIPPNISNCGLVNVSGVDKAALENANTALGVPVKVGVRVLEVSMNNNVKEGRGIHVVVEVGFGVNKKVGVRVIPDNIVGEKPGLDVSVG
jgi:hypothetical protein